MALMLDTFNTNSTDAINKANSQLVPIVISASDPSLNCRQFYYYYLWYENAELLQEGRRKICQSDVRPNIAQRRRATLTYRFNVVAVQEASEFLFMFRSLVNDEYCLNLRWVQWGLQ